MYFNVAWTVPPPQESLTKTRSWKRSEQKNKGDNVYSALLNPPPTFHNSAVTKHQTRSFAAAFQLVWMLNGSPARRMSSNLGQRSEPIGPPDPEEYSALIPDDVFMSLHNRQRRIAAGSLLWPSCTAPIRWQDTVCLHAGVGVRQ